MSCTGQNCSKLSTMNKWENMKVIWRSQSLKPCGDSHQSSWNEPDKPTPRWGKNLVLTSFPSVSKTSKSSVMRYCVGATSCQMQFLLGGYSLGQPGLVMDPFSLVMKPPQAAEKKTTGKNCKTNDTNVLWRNTSAAQSTHNISWNDLIPKPFQVKA